MSAPHPGDQPSDRALTAGLYRFVGVGENTIAIDCDVLQADGGTRTAAITGAYVALADAVTYLAAHGKLADDEPLVCDCRRERRRRGRPGARRPSL